MTEYLPNLKRWKGYFPHASLEGKRNFKRNFLIERDGSIIECVYLWVPDQRLREEIICIHFLRNYVKGVIQEDVGVRIASRDKPWDFGLEISNGDIFNIEIVGIADSLDLFRKNKQEETVAGIAHLETIPLRTLEKLSHYFLDVDTDALIAKYKDQKFDVNAQVKNPCFENKVMFVSSSTGVTKKMSVLIAEAIELKVAKPHSDKSRTILIIDNRTSGHDIDDFREALEATQDLIESSPFREIWFYTGYYSDDDGGNSECAWSVLWAPAEILARIEEAMKNDGIRPDKDGIASW